MFKHWTSAILSLLRNISSDVAFPTSRRFRFSKQWLSFGLNYDNRCRAEAVGFRDIYPQAEDIVVPLEPVRYSRSNINPYELYCLCCIAIIKEARHIFEIGTYDGATAFQLAKCRPDCEVVTIDLPPNLLNALPRVLVDSEFRNIQEGGVGSRYIDTLEASRIVQLYGDSTHYDYSPYYGTMDLVFVDACHDYNYARADSETALRLIRPGGAVVWHDYESGWPGVVKAVDHLLPNYPILHIEQTALALLDTSPTSARGDRALES